MLSSLKTSLPTWDQAKTIDDIELASPSLYEISHYHNVDAAALQQQQQQQQQTNEKIQQAQATLYDDIRDARTALDLFFNSKITECLDMVIAKRHASMYHALCYACLLGGTAILTFQRQDIAKAIAAMKDTYQLADKFRLHSWKQRLRGINKRSHTIQDIKKMTPLQRHAELVFAETYLMKAGLQILYDQNLVFAIKEALKAYTAHSIYKSLENYMLHVQSEASLGKDVSEYGLDRHLQSGIAFGMAGFNLALSAVPDFLLRMVQYVGFQGDRTLAMYYCTSTGGWNDERDGDKTKGQQQPDEGLRRQFCDLILMGYNIVLCKMTRLSHVDQALGDRVLNYHLQQYPNGMVFLALKGRQLATQRQLAQAKVYYQKAMDAQSVWPQLNDVCRWEFGTLALVEQDWRRAYDMFRTLLKQSHWSPCVYSYLTAVSLYMVALDLHPPGAKRNSLLTSVAQSMKQVTKAKQKIAGKSIFIEKFFARKSRKFDLQGNRLLFPDLEILLAIGALELMPVSWIHKNLTRISSTLKRLETNKSFYVHDDICLSHLLRATLYRFLLEQEQEEKSDTQPKLLGEEELKRQHPYKITHRQSIDAIMEHAPKVQLDHWVYYFALYEKAQLLLMDQAYMEAKRELDAIVRHTEKHEFGVGSGQRAKSKYSMENALILKTHSCLGFIAEVATKGSMVGRSCSRSTASSCSKDKLRPKYSAGPSYDGLEAHSGFIFTRTTSDPSTLERKNSI